MPVIAKIACFCFMPWAALRSEALEGRDKLNVCTANYGHKVGRAW